MYAVHRGAPEHGDKIDIHGSTKSQKLQIMQTHGLVLVLAFVGLLFYHAQVTARCQPLELYMWADTGFQLGHQGRDLQVWPSKVVD
jgi:hypothetical protein